MSGPATNNTLSSTTSSPASSSSCLDGLTTHTITPASSATPLPVTPAESASSGSVSETTAELRKELDQKLEAFILKEDCALPQARPAADIPVEGPPSVTYLPEFECAFGFFGAVGTPEVIPETKDAFITAVRAEIEVIGEVQKGMQSYQTAINSRKHHTFSTEFLINQNTAIVISIDQLDQVAAHLKKVKKKVETIEDEDGTVKKEFLDAFKQAQPWVLRMRAILRHCHVFFKVNFVLASEKQSTGQ